MVLKNVSPLGALWVPDLGREVDAGEVFEVDGDLAAGLLQQPANFEAVADGVEG